MNKIYITIIMYFLNKIPGLIIKNTNGLYEQRIGRMYFTKADSNGNDRFPSDNPYTGEHPILFFIQHNCVNAHFFVDANRVFIIQDINKLKFITFVFMNHIFTKMNKIFLFNLSDKHKNGLSLKHNINSDCPPHVNISEEYDLIKSFYNQDIAYYPEKKYIDKFCNYFHITLH